MGRSAREAAQLMDVAEEIGSLIGRAQVLLTVALEEPTSDRPRWERETAELLADMRAFEERY